jgi:hypothetical protein
VQFLVPEPIHKNILHLKRKHSSTVARWLKSMLEKAGIETGIFKAHLVRGTATSAAASAGVTTADILKAADWSPESVFTKFITSQYALVHLERQCSQRVDTSQTTTVDM